MLKSLVSTQFRSAAAAFGKRAQSLRLKSTEASDDARKAYREFLKSKSVNEAPLGMTGATYRNVYHYTSYALLVGVPVAFLTGPPLSSVLDNVFAIALPLHGYLGLRSVLVDYVPGAAMKTLSIRILFGVSAVTALALLSLNSNDIGLTGTVKRLWYDYSEDDNQSEEKVDEVTKMKQEVKAAVSKATKAE